MIRVKYKMLIITELQIIITILRNLTNFPSIFSKFIKNLHQHFSQKLHQFFMKLVNSFWFILYKPSSPTVLRNPLPTTSKSWLFIMRLSMAFWSFFQFKQSWAEARVPIIFLNLYLHLFWIIVRKSFKNTSCHLQGTKIRISPFRELL